MLPGGQEGKLVQQSLGRVSASLAQLFTDSSGFIVRGKVDGEARKAVLGRDCWG